MEGLDPRRHAFRADLADAALQGRVAAPRYAEGQPRRVASAVLDLRSRPDLRAPLESQLLFGETVRTFDERAGWAWVQNDRDGCVGYAPAEGLGKALGPPTHEVTALLTHVLEAPDVKAPALGEPLTLTAAVIVAGREGAFLELATGGWLPEVHAVPFGSTDPDVAATALRLVGLPYLWGGRSPRGLDCSALVQLALARAGCACPRDSDQQAEEVGDRLPSDASPRRGDVLGYPGHVAIALDAERVVHATAYGMHVVVEARGAVEARVRAERGHGLVALRRPRVPGAAGGEAGG